MGMPETRLEYEKISIGQIRKQSIMELLFDFLGGGMKFEKNRIGVYCKKKKQDETLCKKKKTGLLYMYNLSLNNTNFWR